MTHHDFTLYKKSIDFVTEIYEITRGFPSEEKFGLTSQLRRAAVSIPANISEGSARRTKKELSHFLYIALGSISEIEALLDISINLTYLSIDEGKKYISILMELKKMDIALIKSISTSSNY